jgi:uncharacterized protein YecE (DUF72 family)
MASVYVGTSGWNYREWRGGFFPADLPTKRWLSFYASHFNSVEINYTFYRLPTKETCEAWYGQTPAKFRFVVKASRYITHIKRLREARKSWSDFLERVLVLKEKLGPILLQFPSNFRASEANLQTIDEFLVRWPRRVTSRAGVSGSVVFRFANVGSSAQPSRRTGHFAIEQISST